MTVNIDGVAIGPGHPPYIIAELSANHNGSLERALSTIDEAKRRGASAIKLQTYTADTMTIDCDRPEYMIEGGPWSGYKLYDLYKWAETPFEWHKAMFDHARKIGITVFSTPFDESAVDLLEELRTVRVPDLDRVERRQRDHAAVGTEGLRPGRVGTVRTQRRRTACFRVQQEDAVEVVRVLILVGRRDVVTRPDRDEVCSRAVREAVSLVESQAHEGHRCG